MGKLLLLLLVVGVALWLLGARRRVRPRDDKTPGARPPGKPVAPSTMLACQHCGVHVPQAEAVVDDSGRAFCSEAHRLAGPP